MELVGEQKIQSILRNSYCMVMALPSFHHTMGKVRFVDHLWMHGDLLKDPSELLPQSEHLKGQRQQR